MNFYRDGSQVALTIPYADANDNAVSPDSASYRLLAEDNSELIASTPVTINQGDTSATITIDASYNTLSLSQIRVLRTLELTMVTAAGTIATNTRYFVEADETLTIALNSFQTYNQALNRSYDMLNLSFWESASERERKKALIEAHTTLCKMNYKLNLGYYTDRIYLTEIVSLLDLDEAGLAALDATFLDRLHKAQIAQANFMLGGNTIEDKRRIGLMSETVGESSNMFRPGKPLIMPLCDAAMSYIGGYLDQSVRIGRA